MSETKGKLTTCDRCGEEIFLKYIGKGETDGGYTTWDRFEDLPEEWMFNTQIGYLCPHCAGIFRTFIHRLMNFDQRKIAQSWQMKPGDEDLLETIIF